MKNIYLLLFLLIIASCTQKNDHPENMDAIYKDLVAELAIATKSLAEEEKNLQQLNDELALAIPQTGQVKFSKKKVYDSMERVNTLKQQKLYFEIKIEQRIHHAKVKYQESLLPNGKPWPDKEEIETYNNLAKFRRDRVESERKRNLKKIVPRRTDEK